ncbi:hsp70-binding protein 1-like [Anthonomus grandis grandis]|uniref:hsp70-binding protein 1-like n=1 Tax=Anthonomus grandis grandis TaxID=2921223 RepID=UPI002166A63F|nr:hsp70-binding protein 1-like [Anthonomus grandis grandis]
MPGIPQRPEVAGALVPVPIQPGNNDPVQPRQPTDLQGLLRFCMEATQSEDAPNESQFAAMDEEKRKWLENALRSMTIDVMELLRKQIEILQKVDKIKEGDDVSEYENAVEIILDHVDHIDIACDFHKIGGFMVLYPCLKCPHPKIRAFGCELLAVLCQHNPYCQKVVLENEFVPKLLSMIEKDEDICVTIKALYALSAIIRHCQEGFSQFIHYNGPVILLHAMSRGDDKLVTKATFLLDSLCDSQPDFKSRLVFLEYVPTLISLLSKERQPSHEHVLRLLARLIEENATALTECRNPRHNLQQVLQKYIEDCGNKEECLEEVQHSKRILYLVFGLH